MNPQELKQHLETQRKSLPERDFFSLILELLEKTSLEETRKILETYLLNYSFVDEDRVALYLEQFLSDSHRDRAEFAILEIFTLAKKPGSLAKKILDKFTEEISPNSKTSLSKFEKSSSRKEEMEQYLDFQQNKLSEKEFFELVISMIEKDHPEETHNILKAYLLTYSFVDNDRVVRYLEPLLSDPNPVQREFAALQLSILARESNSLAYKILANYIGEELTSDDMDRAIMKRFFKLLPNQDSEDN